MKLYETAPPKKIPVHQKHNPPKDVWNELIHIIKKAQSPLSNITQLMDEYN